MTDKVINPVNALKIDTWDGRDGSDEFCLSCRVNVTKEVVSGKQVNETILMEKWVGVRRTSPWLGHVRDGAKPAMMTFQCL